MRIIIRFTENSELVPIQNQNIINSYIHKCLGKNNQYHDLKNDYCVSHLLGGKLNSDKQTLSFKNGGFIVITSKDELFLNKLLGGIISNQALDWGMNFKMFDFIKEDFIGQDVSLNKQKHKWYHFSTLSPFIIKKYVDKKTYTFSTLNDSDFNLEVKKHTINKMKAIYPNINLNEFDLKINNHPSHKIKKILVKNVINKANQCQISVFCTADVAEKLYNMGIGQSVGSGFGTIYKTENHNKYKI